MILIHGINYPYLEHLLISEKGRCVCHLVQILSAINMTDCLLSNIVIMYINI